MPTPLTSSFLALVLFWSVGLYYRFMRLAYPEATLLHWPVRWAILIRLKVVLVRL